MASGTFRHCLAAWRDLRLRAGSRRRRPGSGPGARPDRRGRARSAGRSLRPARLALGAGRGCPQAHRPAFPSRPARPLASPPDPCCGPHARGSPVRAGGRGALPRTGFRRRRDRRQSQGTRLHRLAPPEPRCRAARRAAMAGPDRCRPRSQFRADALASAFRAFAAAALEFGSARHSQLAGRAVPCPQPPTRNMDIAR